MLAPELLKYLPGGTNAPMGYILQPLTNGFLLISGSGNVKQALISFGILHDSRSLTIRGKHYRAFTFFQLLYEVAGLPAKCRQRLDVFGDVKHASPRIEAPS
jgi:hypothetical protein